MARPTGGTRHSDPLAGRVRVLRMSGSAERRRQCTLPAQGHARLPLQVRQRLLDAIHASHPFRTVLRELRLTLNQVWGLTKTDAEWSAAAEAALTATRRDDLKHWTNAAYVALRLQGV